MTRFSRALALSLLLAGAAPAFAAATYTSDLLLSADFKAPGPRRPRASRTRPKWVRSGNGTSSPLEAVVGTPYQSGSVCKPHDCASHYMQLLVDAKAKRVWGVLIDRQIAMPPAKPRPSLPATPGSASRTRGCRPP